MRNRFIFLFLLVQFTLKLSSQTFLGKVCDQQHHPIAYASIVAKTINPSAIVAFTQTDGQGKYTLTVKKHKHLLLEFSSLSYAKDSLQINIDRDTLYLKDVMLHSAPICLKEVEIRPNIPIFYKKDTVVFNVASFSRGNEHVIEDILKNIPGIAVDKQGTIRANGKEVEAVLLEGDNLLNKGYSLLTKGLAASAVKQVELIHKYSENRLLKDFVNSDKIALNLKLDEHHLRHQWFGRANLGYGDRNRYIGQANLVGVGKRDKYFITSTINNSGYKAVADISEILDRSETDFATTLFVKLGLTLPDMDLERCNFNQEKMLSGSSILRPSKNCKIKLATAFDGDRRSSFFRSSQDYLLDGLSFSRVIEHKAIEHPLTFIGRAQISADLSANEALECITQYRSNHLRTKSSTLLNESMFNERLMTVDDFFSQKVIYTHRFSSRDLVKVNSYFIYEQTPQHYTVDSLDSGLRSDLRRFYQSTSNRRQKYTMDINYVHNFNVRHSLSGTLGTAFDRNKISSSNQFQKDEGMGLLLRLQSNYYGSLRYRLLFGKTTFVCGGKLNYYDLNLKNRQRGNEFALDPFVVWEFKPFKKQIINLSWLAKSHSPSLFYLYPNVIRNSLSTNSYGDSDNSTAVFQDQVASLNYQYGNWSDIFLANIKLLYFRSNRYYSSEFYITPEQTFIKAILERNKEMYSVAADLNYYVPFLSSNIKLSTEMEKVHYQYYISSLGNQFFKSVNYRCGLSLKSAFTGLFNFDMGGSYSHKTQKNDQLILFNSNLFANLLFSTKNWTVESSWQYYSWNGRHGIKASNYCFMDIEANYILKPNKWILSLKGKNLLNVKTYIEKSFDEVSQNEFESKLLPRNIQISMEYRF